MLEVAIEAATTAGKFLKKNLGKVRDIQRKEGQEKNLVTEIDKKSEEMIIAIIRKHFPKHDILAEESGAKGAGTTGVKWIIDPLDGTTNYTHAFPVFCVSIGVEVKDELTYGVIYDPNMNELFTAEKGKGAFLNGKKIHVSATKELKNSLLVTGFPYNIAENPNRAIERFVKFLVHAQAVRRMGSAAIDLAYVAAGRYDGFWEVELNPWDMAAGALLVTEAGGMLSDFSGNPFSVYNKEVMATNGIVQKQMLEVLS